MFRITCRHFSTGSRLCSFELIQQLMNGFYPRVFIGFTKPVCQGFPNFDVTGSDMGQEGGWGNDHQPHPHRVPTVPCTVQCSLILELDTSLFSYLETDTLLPPSSVIFGGIERLCRLRKAFNKKTHFFCAIWHIRSDMRPVRSIQIIVIFLSKQALLHSRSSGNCYKEIVESHQGSLQKK